MEIRDSCLEMSSLGEQIGRFVLNTGQKRKDLETPRSPPTNEWQRQDNNGKNNTRTVHRIRDFKKEAEH